MDYLAYRSAPNIFQHVHHQVLPQYHISGKWHVGQDAGTLLRISRSWPRRTGLPFRQLAERAIVEHPIKKTGTVEKRKDGVVCTHLISAYRNNFCRQKKKRPTTSPPHPPCITWLYTTSIYTDNKVKLSTKVYTSRWGTFKVHHHPQSTWLYTPYIYTDNKVKLSTKLYTSRWVRFNRHHP